MTKQSLWILLNPRKNAVADRRLRHLLQESRDFGRVQGQQPILGLIVLSTYFRNWRKYMAFYEEEELSLVSDGS